MTSAVTPALVVTIDDERDHDAAPGDVRPTRLTQSLAQGLDRPPPGFLAPSTLRTLVAGFVTAGLYPAFRNARRLEQAATWRWHLFEHVAEWVDLHRGREAAKQLAAAERPSVVIWLARLAVLLAVAAAGVAVWFCIARQHELGRLWVIDPFRGTMPHVSQVLFLGLLGGSFLVTWLGSNLYLRRGNRLLAEVEAALDVTPRKAKRPPAWEWGVRPISGTVGAILAYLGITWALPMLVSAAAVGRTVTRHDRLLLRQLGGRLRESAGRDRPAPTLPRVPVHAKMPTCVNDACRTPLAEDAAFCPRCGQRA
jgi:hypothetical protein